MSSSVRSGIDADVHQGLDGWLFLTGGSNRVIDYYIESETFTDEMARQWTSLFAERAARCGRMNATYLHMIVPDKITTYYDKFDGQLPFRHQSPAFRIPFEAKDAGLGNHIIDILPYFLKQKAEYMLFWKTDTHWTFEGCLCAYQMLCNSLQPSCIPDLVTGKRIEGQIVLDLGAKMSPPVQENFSCVRFLRTARRVGANTLVTYKERANLEQNAGLHVGCNVVFCNFSADADPRTLVVFGDSYSEYRAHLLTGMLAETFREVHFIWSTSIDWNYVERIKPDLVLTETAERFAAQVPIDNFNIDTYVAKVLARMH